MNRSFLTLLIILLLIVTAGILSVYSSTAQKEVQPWKQQMVRAAIGVMVFIFISQINYRRWWDAVYILYALSLFLLLLVVVSGIASLGAQRWIRFGVLNFQPSEFAKISIVLLLARYFSKRSMSETSLSPRKLNVADGLFVPLLFVAVPMGLIIEQPDLGSALMIFFIFFAMLMLTNLKMRYLVMFLLLIILPMPLFWHFLRDYQKARLMVFLNPNADPLGAGYTLIQSKIAMGSGGFLGKGWLSGTQSQLRFLPESHTDFIFATFSEEWGFVGSSLVLFLYYFLIREGFRIAQRTSYPFGRLLAYGISLLIGIQAFINIAMTMGLMPIVGLPLPLMSYGGSSLVVTCAALGILANIDKTRSVF